MVDIGIHVCLVRDVKTTLFVKRNIVLLVLYISGVLPLNADTWCVLRQLRGCLKGILARHETN